MHAKDLYFAVVQLVQVLFKLDSSKEFYLLKVILFSIRTHFYHSRQIDWEQLRSYWIQVNWCFEMLVPEQLTTEKKKNIPYISRIKNTAGDLPAYSQRYLPQLVYCV